MAGEVIDLETPEPTPPVAAVPDPVAPPVPEPPPDPDEVGAVQIQEGKYVPVAALAQARADVRQLKEVASKVPAMEQELAQLRGSLQTYQQVQQQLQNARPPAVPQTPQTDPRLVQLARSLDYFKGDGTPDLDRAAAHRELVREEARQMAQEMVGPLQQQTHQTQSQANFHQALSMVPENLREKMRPQLQQFWATLPPNYTADPRVAAAMPALALGMDILQGGGSKLQPAPPANAHPPVVTESVGGGTRRTGPTLSEAEQLVIRSRGMSDKTYQEHTKNFVKGRTNVLEDE